MSKLKLNKPCQIIGVLDNGRTGLDPSVIACIQCADVVIGGTRTLSLFSDVLKDSVQRKDLTDKLTQVPDWVNSAKQAGQSVVVLATGDPLCYGIANYLLDKLGHDVCDVIPSTSTLQLACARFGIAWSSARICSLHSKDVGDWHDKANHTHGLYPLLQLCQQHSLIAVFTSPENSPDRIARMLKRVGLGNAFTISVAANLLTDEENIDQCLMIGDAANMSFADPNIVVLRRQMRVPNRELFGLDDNRYVQRKPDNGLITKREVRAVSLARLQLRCNSIVWDIGAGSGAVGLEAAQLCRDGYVYAIEKNVADADITRQNQQHFAIYNYQLIHARAPDQLDTWPDPDAVFIGGSGGELAELIKLCLRRLKEGSWLVMNFVTLENLNNASDTLKQLGVCWDVIQLQANRSRPILHMHRMQAENPVWIVCAQAGSEKDE